MRRILRKILAGEEDQLGDITTVSFFFCLSLLFFISKRKRNNEMQEEEKIDHRQPPHGKPLKQRA